MKQKIEKELIVSLIKDDLINSKLVNGLNQAGLNADHYYLHLSEIIFRLIGFKESIYTDSIYEEYLKLLEKGKDIDTSKSNIALEKLAQEIYAEITTHLR